MRKNNNLIGLILSAAIFLGASCERSDDPVTGEIDGTYVGIFTESSSLKSALINEGGAHGTAEVVMTGENQIRVHCFGEEIDTTFLLDYYEHIDSIMVCLSGHDFASEYGHLPGEGHMSGGMMGDMQGGETSWMHHMNDEHLEGDEHFGGFNLQDGTFAYTFRMMENSTLYYLKFHGTKE